MSRGPGKNYDPIPEILAEVLKANGVAPTPRLVEDLRKAFVELATDTRYQTTRQQVEAYFAKIGLTAQR